jgi:hypothetical protein
MGADLTTNEMKTLGDLANQARGPLQAIADFIARRNGAEGGRMTLPLGGGRVAVLLTDREHRRLIEDGTL